MTETQGQLASAYGQLLAGLEAEAVMVAGALEGQPVDMETFNPVTGDVYVWTVEQAEQWADTLFGGATHAEGWPGSYLVETPARMLQVQVHVLGWYEWDKARAGLAAQDLVRETIWPATSLRDDLAAFKARPGVV